VEEEVVLKRGQPLDPVEEVDEETARTQEKSSTSPLRQVERELCDDEEPLVPRTSIDPAQYPEKIFASSGLSPTGFTASAHQEILP
jgi:hypothetical protein